VSAAACLALVLLLAAVISPGARASADVVDQILERGYVRVGVAPFVPWTIERESGELDGFEIDVGRRLARDMEVEARFVLYEFEDIIPALRRGEIDVIAAGMAVTPARALRVAFSIPYSESGVSLAANRERTRKIASLDGLNEPGVPVAVVEETLAAELAVRLFDRADVRAFRTVEAAEAALVEGEVHAYLASRPEVEFLALRYPDAVDVPVGRPLLASKAAFGVAHGEQRWLNFLNAWVTARTADRWIESIHAYWFKSLEWSDEAD
jgi:polar amino acid transport system substrate-binding protein